MTGQDRVAQPTRIDDSKAKAVKGVRQVITIPSGVAVLADGYWAAKKGRDALAIDWNLGPHADLSSAKVSDMLREGADNANAVAKDLGNLRDAAEPTADAVSAGAMRGFVAWQSGLSRGSVARSAYRTTSWHPKL